MIEWKRVLAIVPLMALTAGAGCQPRSNAEDANDEGPEVSFTMPRLPRWTSADVSVREGAGTVYAVVARLQRGERVEIGALENGWYEVFQDGERLGYVAQGILLGTPIPDSAFELRDVAFEVVERGDTRWRYTWTIALENTGREALEGLEAEVKFVDANSYLVGADTARGLSLAPGQRRAFRGEVSFDLPRGAEVRTIGAEIRRPEQ